tara:strand:- start:12764 stop:13363 length:600 start_codon:yes stop_codon:yes gene_type:complete
VKEIVIASSNKHKVSEITQKIHSYFQKIYSLSDFPKIGDIKEDGNSVLENSFIKSRVTFDYTNIPSVADDTALEVDYLNGDPGLFTARYAGENVTYDDNMNKLLNAMDGVPFDNRTARFRTVVTYVDGGINDFFVEGILEGYILEEKQGEFGFGYDPVFFVPEKGKSLASISSEIKNEISHRGLAIDKFKNKINQLSNV